ncbi:MAG: Gfo/Idh/MocA family oxidoreductase [Bacteroidales bacterium]|nr:Gfo/Idh/MocA family oxidoreductase [Bacteroidales bacterium]
MNRFIFVTIASLGILIGLASCGNEAYYGYTVRNGIAVYNTPDRPADQISMIGFTTEPIDTVKVGVIGLGMRGYSAVERFTYIEGVEITALCDIVPERVERTQNILVRHGLSPAAGYDGEDAWKELCERDDIDLVYIVTDWKMHTPMAVYAMEHGKHVAIEVPAATSIAECWQLVNTAEKTRRHCMMLENCVYDFFELTTLNMAQHGLFGEVIHAEGAYIHNLDPYWKNYYEGWRYEFNKNHRGDVYPTHGLGPACQVLNIHRGDKMNTLVSMDTKAFNGLKVAEQFGETEYANGDHTITLIQTEKGKIIEIQHNVVTPRPYNRMYQVEGTEGFANKYPNEGYSIRTEGCKTDEHKALDDLTGSASDGEAYLSTEARDALMEQYKHPIIRDIEEKAKQVGGHGGMDFIMDYRLIYCLNNGLPLDQDVYDAAEWSCLGELTRVSIENGNIPVVMPDFTRGDWNKLDGYKHAIAE